MAGFKNINMQSSSQTCSFGNSPVRMYSASAKMHTVLEHCLTPTNLQLQICDHLA